MVLGELAGVRTSMTVVEARKRGRVGGVNELDDGHGAATGLKFGTCPIMHRVGRGRSLRREASLGAVLEHVTIWFHIRPMSMDLVFKALADPVRRQLLDRLHARNGQTLGELCEGYDMTRQAVAKHLGILEEANLVVVQWSGREKLHFLNPVPIHEIAERWIHKFEASRLDALSDLKKSLEGKDHG